MLLLAEFEPRLVGPVLSGTATPHQEISLHVFSDTAEAVSIKLLDDHIQYRVAEHRVKMNADRVLQYPAVQFSVFDHPVDATVFPRDGIRQAPLSPTDGRPMRRASASEVRALVAAPPEEPPY
jgi:hypothetical protein